MTPDTFLSEFGHLANAPNGIKQLREMILSLAVQGKLVPQDPEDEPAAELLERIAIGKERLVTTGKVRRSRPPPSIAPDETTAELPPSWEEVRLLAVCCLENGDRGKNYPNKSALVPEGIPFINAGHLSDGRIGLREMNFIPQARFDRLRGGKVQEGDLLFCLRGSLGKCALVEGLEAGAIASSLVIVRPVPPAFPTYLLLYLRSPLASKMIKRFDNGTAQPNLSARDLGRFILPLPPLAEQQRIVAKVDELMGVCDELEARQTKARTVQVNLCSSALKRLGESKDTRELRTHWQFVHDTFPKLLTRPENVSELRKTILQLAVTGGLSPSSDDWVEVTVGECASLLNGYAFRSSWFRKEGVRLVRNANVGHGTIDWTDAACLDEDQAGGFVKWRLSEGDIVLSLDRPLISTGLKVARTRRQDLPCLLLQRVAKPEIDPGRLSAAYLFLWFQSPAFCDAINPGRSKGVPHISTRQVEGLAIDLPPLPEQDRIVAKVDELMHFCDRLEQQLTDAQDTAETLAATTTSAMAGT